MLYKHAFVGLILGASIGVASGAVSVTVTNITGTTGAAITDSSGAVTGDFSWAVGSFSGTTFTDAASVSSQFTANGSSLANSFAFDGFFNGPAIEDAATSVGPGSPLIGNPIYVVLGNNTDFSLSTDYIVFETGELWPEEVEIVGATATINLQSGSPTLLYGQTTTVSGATGPFAGNNGGTGFTFGAVPEPSIALLGALGILGLVRRRR